MDTYIGVIGKGNDDEIYDTAAQILRNGGLVAFPTETVYGLGAYALTPSASARIYSAKGRPSDNPLIVHIADINDLDRLVKNISDKARALMDRFWPGPMTLVFEKSDIVPYETTGGLDTVAVRFPSHKTARRLISESRCFIAAPSANTSGRPSPTLASHVIEDMSGKIDMIIADDTVDIGIESTIIDVSTDEILVLRPGFITLDMIREVVGSAELDPAIAGNSDYEGKPKAPGMKYRHYAPKAELKIIKGDEKCVIEYINQKAGKLSEHNQKVGIMATDETCGSYTGSNIMVKSLGSSGNEADIAKNLYEALRFFDSEGVEIIFSESFPCKNVGQATMNRLIKAAGHCVVEV